MRRDRSNALLTPAAQTLEPQDQEGIENMQRLESEKWLQPAETSNRGSHRKRMMLLVLCVLVAATPLLVRVDLTKLASLASAMRSSDSVERVEEVMRPARRVATGDLHPLKRLIEQQTNVRLTVFAALTVTLGIYVMLRD